MTDHVRKSDGGYVTTYETRDDKDRPVYSLQVRALTPTRVKVAELAAGCTTIATIGLGQMALAAGGAEAGAHIAALIATIATGPLQRLGWRHQLRKQTDLQVDPEYFAFKTGKGWQPYPREQVGNFARQPHLKAQKEARQIEFKQREATRKGQTYKPEYVFVDSFHLSFLNLKSGVKFLEVYGVDAADDILGEINSFLAITEGQRGYGRGITVDTKDDWTGDTGTLPQGETQEWGYLPAPAQTGETATQDTREQLTLIEGGKDDDD